MLTYITHYVIAAACHTPLCRHDAKSAALHYLLLSHACHYYAIAFHDAPDIIACHTLAYIAAWLYYAITPLATLRATLFINFTLPLRQHYVITACHYAMLILLLHY